MRFERDEVVAEHQFGGNAAEKLGIDALFAEIDEGAAIALGQAASLFALGGVAGRTPRIAGLLLVMAIEFYPPVLQSEGRTCGR